METSGFFNSSNGDRIYDAADFAGYFGKLVSNGIFYSDADVLRIIPSSGMVIQALPGSAWINGYNYENTDALELTVDMANGVHPRLDRVVLRWSALERHIKLAIKTGVAQMSPSAPALTRNSDVFELGIADISVGRGVLTITADDITDLRLISNLCGTVNSLVGAVYE